MLRNVKQAWWRSMVQLRHDVVGLDAAILSSPKIWEASGHLANFTDPLVDCRNCKERWRADHLEPDPSDGQVHCPNCGSTDLTDARAFNLMFKTYVGPVEDESNVAYLRPETAQGHFVNFLNVLQTSRKRPPFGIAQIGKSFRNEITPGNFVFRTREFEQMELEYFVPPDEAPKWFEYWCEQRMQWYIDLGIPADRLRLRPHTPDELSHYSNRNVGRGVPLPWGWGELEGVANRTDYDLKAHAAASGENSEYFDQASDERYVPYVIEPAAGATRTMMAFLLAAFDEDEVGGERRTVLRLHPRLAPYQVAVLPLSQEGDPAAGGPGGAGAPAAGRHVRLRRDPIHRPALPAPGRDRHAAGGDRRLRIARGPGRHHPGPGHDRAGAGADRRWSTRYLPPAG